MDKIYTIFAGVNGSGKSTLYQYQEFDKTQPRINPDEIVQNIGSWKNVTDQIAAAKIAVHQIKRYIEEGISFNQETTLTGKTIINNIIKSKEKGFKIDLYYIGLDNYNIAINRVKSRVEKGGHDIPEDVIQKRYQESFRNLKKILPYCDTVTIYDNTEKFKQICYIENRKIGLKMDCNWFESVFHSYQTELIKKDLIKSGYLPNKRLIENMEQINHVFNNFYSVKDIKKIYQNKSALNLVQKEIIEKAANDFIKQEKLEKRPSISLEP